MRDIYLAFCSIVQIYLVGNRRSTVNIFVNIQRDLGMKREELVRFVSLYSRLL